MNEHKKKIIQSHCGSKTFNLKKIINKKNRHRYTILMATKTIKNDSHRPHLSKTKLHDRGIYKKLDILKKSAQCLRRVRRVRTMGVVTLGVSLSAMTASEKKNQNEALYCTINMK